MSGCSKHLFPMARERVPLNRSTSDCGGGRRSADGWLRVEEEQASWLSARVASLEMCRRMYYLRPEAVQI